jgi:hypothetical protein
MVTRKPAIRTRNAEGSVVASSKSRRTAINEAVAAPYQLGSVDIAYARMYPPKQPLV